jgi:transaldolase
MGSQPANALSALQDVDTVLIADTADFQRKCSAKFSREMLTSSQVIEKFKPSEGTTNPSLLYSAAQNPAYSSLLARTIKYAKSLEPPTLVSNSQPNILLCSSGQKFTNSLAECL